MSRVRRVVTTLAIIVGLLAPAASPVRAAEGLVVGSYARLTVHRLEMRNGPGVEHAAVVAIDKGEIVRVVSGPRGCAADADGCVGGWYKAAYRKWSGYLPQDGLAHTGLAGKSIARQFNRVVVVSLGRQQVEVYHGRRLILITPTTTGKPATPTRKGTFRVIYKRSPFVFRSADPPGSPEWYADSPVEMAIKFNESPDLMLHDAPWRPRGGYGYGTNERHVDPDGRMRQGSHGCVNLPLWSTRKIWGWIRVGDVVRVVSH